MKNLVQSDPTNFSDRPGECPETNPIPQTAEEVRAVLEQNYFDLQMCEVEYGKPYFKSNAAAASYEQRFELYEEELIGEIVPTEEEIQEAEHFKKVYNAGMKKAKGRRKGKVGKQGEVSESEPPCSDSAPPIDNMGVEKYMPTPPSPPSVSDGVPPHFGGYDGGVEVGFNGYWSSPAALQAVAMPLRVSQQEARAKNYQKPVVTDLNGRKVEISAKGATCGPYYEFVFESDGVKFYIHGNPYKKNGQALVENFQAIRIRYDATRLMRMTLYEAHQKTLQFLSDLGFIIKKEKVSRVDLQVITPIPVKKFADWHFGLYTVCRARSDHFHRSSGRFETITLGNKKRIELCIYDKRVEMTKAKQSETLKDVLFIQNCCGQEWYESKAPITRIEYRIGRKVLKEFEIDTINDLLEREKGLVAYLTTDWFRILKKPKHRGHENKQEIHPEWKAIQDRFKEWFTGHPEREDMKLQRREKPIAANTERLYKQALGCISSAVAGSVKVSKEAVHKFVEKFILTPVAVMKMAQKAFEKQVVIETKTGCVIGGEPASQDKSEFDHEKNCGMSIDVKAILDGFFGGLSPRRLPLE